jgi:hypothetical protein
MRFVTESEWEEHEKLFDEQGKIIEELKKGKMDEIIFLKKIDEIGKKLIKLASFTNKSFEEFKSFMRTNFPDPSIEERIQHEKEHAKVIERYGFDFVYCIIAKKPIILPKPSIYLIEQQPKTVCHVREFVVDFLFPKAQGWSREEILNYLKEVFIAGTKGAFDKELGKKDMEFIKIINSSNEIENSD